MQTQPCCLADHVLSHQYGIIMLRVTTIPNPKSVVLKLEGKLIGPWVGVAEESWRALSEGTSCEIIVDLDEVISVDAPGLELLRTLQHQGARFHTDSIFARQLIDRVLGAQE